MVRVRAEPMCYGLEKLVATCTLCDEGEGTNHEAVVDMLEALPTVQSARLLSMQSFGGDPFTLCSGLFTIKADDAPALALETPGLTIPAVQQLLQSGYTVIDGFIGIDMAAEVAGLVKASLTGYPDERVEDGIEWYAPGPRNARGDLTTWIKPDMRPTTDTVFEEAVVPAFDCLQRDLRLMMRLQGCSERQLAWYPATGAGYRRHTDAMPDDDPESTQRKVTAILYCNPGWEPQHGGALRLWLTDHEGGGSVDVSPVAGRLLIFLSGCMLHEVLPSFNDRQAITTWFW